MFMVLGYLYVNTHGYDTLSCASLHRKHYIIWALHIPHYKYDTMHTFLIVVLYIQFRICVCFICKVGCVRCAVQVLKTLRIAEGVDSAPDPALLVKSIE